jgi:hypothetical protein
MTDTLSLFILRRIGGQWSVEPYEINPGKYAALIAIVESDEPARSIRVVNRNGLNVHTEHTLPSPILRTLPYNTVVPVFDTFSQSPNEWVKISAANEWVVRFYGGTIYAVFT